MGATIIYPTWSTQTAQPIEQAAHGFALGTQLYFDGTAWAAAQANSPATLRMATVAQVIDADRFLIAFEGVMNWPAHGLTSGARYYLSDTVAGGITLTPPTAPSTLQQPVLIPLGPDHARLLEYVVPDASGGGTPTGTILASAGGVVPAGFLPCQGDTVERAVYSALFNVIGTNWGAGDGSTTFHLPDLRDWYLRGCGTTNTPGTEFAQSTARPANAFGGNTNSTGSHSHNVLSSGAHTHTTNTAGNHSHTQTTYRTQGSSQAGTNQFGHAPDNDSPQTSTVNAAGDHTHTIASSGAHTHITDTWGSHVHSFTVTTGGDAETRPRSKHVLYLIKF